MIDQEIARLTGTLKWNVDNRPLMAFEKRLEKVTGMLQNFAAQANKKFNIKVSLDSRSLRAQLDRAANATVAFKHFTVSEDAIVGIAMKLKQRLGSTPIVLKGISVNLTDLLEQRKVIRTTLGRMSLQLPVTLRMKEAEQQLRSWKKTTESKYKLHINADISQAKFLANARKSLRDAGGRIGEMKIDIKDPKVRLQVDRDNLREQIRKAIEQQAFKVKVKASTTTQGRQRTTTPRQSAPDRRRERSSAVGGGIMGAGMGFMRGAIPGLGAAFALSQLNQINQQMQGQNLAMTAVMGSQQAGAEQTDWLRNLADQIGFDFRQVGPSFNKMLASGKTSGMSTESVQGIFQGVTEYGRVMGLDNESMKGSMRAIEQMMNKGQVMSEELKGQLAERMPGAISAMAEAAGFGSDANAVAKLFKAMENGEVKSQAVLEKFAKILAQRAREGGALEKAMEATAAQQARFNNAFSRSVEVFAAAGFDKGMGQFFKSLAEGLDTAEPMIKALGEAFSYLVEPVNAVINVGAHLVKWLAELSTALGLTSGQMMAIGIAAGVFLLPFGGMVAVVSALALALDDLIGFMEGKESVFGKWLESNEELRKTFDDTVFALDGLKAAWDDLTASFDEADDNPFEDWKIDNVLISTLEMIKGMVDGISKMIRAVAQANQGDWAGAAKQLGAGFLETVNNHPLSVMKNKVIDTVGGAIQTPLVGAADWTQSLLMEHRNRFMQPPTTPARTPETSDQTQSAGMMQQPKVEVNLTMQIDGMINSGDLVSMVQEPMTKIAQQAFTQAIENARARQKDDR